MMGRAKIVGLVVTPETCLSRASTARLPLISLSRLRSSSQIDTPAARSLASESVIGSSEIVVACVSARAPGGGAGARAGGVLVASGHDAAIDVPDGAGDPAGGRGEQEGDGIGQVAGGADPAERVEAIEAVQRLVQLVGRDEPLVDRGGHDGRSDRVNPDLVRGQF